MNYPIPNHLRHGCVRFVNVEPYDACVMLHPFNGNGMLVLRPGHGWCMVAIPPQGLLANINGCNLDGVGGQYLPPRQVYYAYLAFINNTPQIDFSTIGHRTDWASGIEVKDTDPTRSLIGMLYVGDGIGGTVKGSIAGIAANQLVQGWFNRIASDQYIKFEGQTQSSGYTEPSSANRINFVSWADDNPYGIASAVLQNSASGQITYYGVGVDSVSVPSGVQGAHQFSGSNFQSGVSAIPILGALPEGFHYLSNLMRVSGGRGNVAHGQLHLYLRS